MFRTGEGSLPPRFTSLLRSDTMQLADIDNLSTSHIARVLSAEQERTTIAAVVP